MEKELKSAEIGKKMPVVEEDGNIRIWKIETAPYRTNAYILVCRATQDSVLIDAPSDADRIITALEGTNPTQILITHGHFDHTGALRELKDKLKIPVATHPHDADTLPLVPDLYLKDGDSVTVGKLILRVIHTPGHTPGGLCFIYDRFLFSGDTLFPGGPGRTSTPSDFEQIVKSLKEKIFVLPANTLVYPGHGASSILKKELDEFEVFSSKSHPPELCGDVLWLSS